MKLMAIAIGFFLLVVMSVLTQNDWGNIAQGLCIFYAIATTLFFLAQLWGFVVSQTNYSEDIEEPKFKMLVNEEAEWKGSLAKS